ncbi:hypothetical protein [Streptomyces sp. NPDC086182]|uniref:hypothetical protein n=1 Tax=Streptomyces sp. NPDC086182 TaxID=3155058 RepID=UPI0034176F06
MTASTSAFHLQFKALYERAVEKLKRQSEVPSNRRLAEEASVMLGKTIHDQLIGRWLKGGTPSPAKSEEALAVVKTLTRWAEEIWSGPLERSWRDRVESAAKPRADSSGAKAVGQLITEMDNPFELGVRPSVTLSRSPSDDAPPQLTTYVPRRHDEQLRSHVTDVSSDRNRLVLLIGEVSTGKTRALWEALPHLPPGWRLWHPIDAAELLEGLDAVNPRTVVWLNDTHLYLDPRDGQNCKKVAVGLRSLLRRQGPFLILATLWTVYAHQLVQPATATSLAPHPQVGALLEDSSVVRISIPLAFNEQQLQAVRAASKTDRVLRHAFQRAEGGRVGQTIGGIPVLMERCAQAPDEANAVIEAACDLYRYGHGQDLSHELLKAAASSYLNADQLAILPCHWFEEALEYASEPCRGVPGPVHRTQPDATTYRLAHFLQHLALWVPERDFPGTQFWNAVTTHAATPADQVAFGREAELRGRYRHAVALYEAAAEAGHDDAWRPLIELREILGHEAEATAAALRSGNPDTIREHTELRELFRTGFAWAENLAASASPPALTHLQEEIQHFERQGDLDHALELARVGMKQGEVAASEEHLRLLESAGAHEKASDIAVHNHNLSYLLGWLVAMRSAQDPLSQEKLIRRALDGGHPDAIHELAALRRRIGRHHDADAVGRFGLAAEGTLADAWAGL